MIYHTYADAANNKTFEITDDLTPVINLWKKSGNSDVIPFEKEPKRGFFPSLCSPVRAKRSFSIAEPLLFRVFAYLPADTIRVI